MRSFSPLNASLKAQADARNLQGIVFDVDGTLCEPQNYMFAQMRAVLGIPKTVDILNHIYSLPDIEKHVAMENIKNIEREAMKLQKPQPGLIRLMDYLVSKNVRMGLCTRNFDPAFTDYLSTKSYLFAHHNTGV